MTTSDRRRSYRPGGWFGIFGEHASVLLPPSEKHRVPALWELVDEGAGFDEVLDGLLANGLRDLPGFVLVSEAEHGTKVVLRGPAVAAFVTEGELIELAGASDTTWVERSLTGVTQMFIQVEPTDEEVGEDLTIASGLVRLARVDEPPFAPEGLDEEAGAEAEPSAVEGGPVELGGSAVADELPPPAEPAYLEPEPAWEPPAQSVASLPEPPAPAAAFGVAAPGYPPPLSAEPAEPEPEPEPAEPEPEPEPAEPEAELGGPAPTTDHDGLTSGGWDADLIPRPQSGVATASSQEPGPPVARMLFSTGEAIDVDRPVLVGRAPEVRRFAAHDRPVLVRVPSPHQEISSTHLEVRPGVGVDHGTAVVTDLGSTNGTVLVQPGLAPEDLQPGIAVALVPGAIIDLGEGVTIQVTQPFKDQPFRDQPFSGPPFTDEP